MSSDTVRVRFAPSPTGYFHVGGARSALYNWLFARQNNGCFILRIEDTDRTRYSPEALPALLEGLHWLGLQWDEGPDVGGAYGPYYQSDRLPLYRQYAEQLVAEGRAYRCYCSPERLAALREQQRINKEQPGYDRHCRHLTQQQIADYEAQGIAPVIRLAIPTEGTTEFDDALRGHIAVENQQLGDLVLLKSDGYPTYHLANVVDDHLMAITHILRGDEWMSTVPEHVLLYNAFGWPMPVQAHLPLILDPSGQGKLSKRKKKTADGREMPTYVHEFREAGYLPEALVNFLALVGWSYDDKTEFFTRDELVRYFDLSKVSKAPAVFSYEKLDYMNAAYIRQLGHNDLAGRLYPVLRAAGLNADPDMTLKLVPLIRERIKTLQEAAPAVDFFFQPELEYDAQRLIQKGMDAPRTRAALEAAAARVETITPFEEAALEAPLRALADELGLKIRDLFGAMRIACTGREVSPPLFGTLAVLGKDVVLKRLREGAARL